MLPNLRDAFDSGTLCHPLEGEANSVELFQAVAGLSGSDRFLQTPGSARMARAIGEYEHYLFVLVDGLGMNLQNRFPAGGFFQSNLQTEIRSVYPSTTAVAMTSISTGCWPGEHGLTGWWTNFPEYDRVVGPLIFEDRASGAPAAESGLTVADIVACDPLMSSMTRDAGSYLPDVICDSDYVRWSRGAGAIMGYKSHRTLRGVIRRDRAFLADPSYRYLYFLTVDKYSHSHGVQSPKVAQDVSHIDAVLTRLRRQLPDSVRMIVTADHGLTDVPSDQRHILTDEDAVRKFLQCGPTGEGRAPVFHVHPGKHSDFKAAMADHPGGSLYSLHTPDELAEIGIFGPGPLSSAAKLHLGDYVGVSREPVTLRYRPPGSSHYTHLASHGGLTPDEMRVPLFIA